MTTRKPTTAETSALRPDPTSTDSSIVHESIRNAPVGERAQAALAITLGAVDVTEAQRAEAERIVGESDAHPWRAEWHRREVYSRRGEEAELASLYVSRLGESQATAEEHVRRELSAAWTRHRYPVQQLDAVAETLASERKRLAPRPALTTEARTTTAPKVYRGQVGEYVAVSEQRR